MIRENKDGDWVKCEKFVKEYLIQAKVLEDLAKDFVTTANKMEDLSVKAYASAPLYDALFLDSPLGHQKLWHSIECQFKKLGYAPLCRGIFTPTVDIKNLSEVASDACAWLLKFRKKSEKAV